MSNAALVLHAGAAAASIFDVQKVPTPAPEQNWQPIPHIDLVNLVKRTVETSGYSVVHQSYGLWRDGARMFGVMELRNGSNPSDYALTIGLRNSHDKSFSAGFAIGSRVFVCDNLAFSSEVVLARKHTLNIHRDLPQLVSAGVGRLIDLRGWQDNRIAAYKGCEISDRDAHDIIVQAIDRRVIGPMKVLDVLGEWRQPTHEDFGPRTLWSLFNAFTEKLKGAASELPKRTQALHGLCDGIAGVSMDAKLALAGVEDAEVIAG